MNLSVFDLFKIGIGPSSSHTVGPMRAANLFLVELERLALLSQVARLQVELYGSLAATGRGHGTVEAALLGLCGETPERVDPDQVAATLACIEQQGELALNGSGPRTAFLTERDVLFLPESLPGHPNGMRMRAWDLSGQPLHAQTYYSVGGGFVITADAADAHATPSTSDLPHRFTSGDELLQLCHREGQDIAGLMLARECHSRSAAEVRAGVLAIWQAMSACIDRGLEQTGELPGPLKVKRRAHALHRQLLASSGQGRDKPEAALDWLSLYAMAVNEENASGGRVVTAPTNGAAGIIPAVLRYYSEFIPGADADGIVRFLLTAAAIGILYKLNASISGAEVGCQGEVGVACSMAAAGLCAVLGGTPNQVENAAEMGMEHHLGLTCDPVGGRVQIPCIERNAMGAVKALNAARMALYGDGQHVVSLDAVIRTMMQTGADMQSKYKETSQGGLAVNIIEC